jgi:hypothetical protein
MVNSKASICLFEPLRFLLLAGPHRRLVLLLRDHEHPVLDVSHARRHRGNDVETAERRKVADFTAEERRPFADADTDSGERFRSVPGERFFQLVLDASIGS